MTKTTKTIITYIAEDGKKFDNKDDCIKWENGGKLAALIEYLNKDVHTYENHNKRIQYLKSVNGIPATTRSLEYHKAKFEELLKTKRRAYRNIELEAHAIDECENQIRRDCLALAEYRVKRNHLGEVIKNRKKKILEMEQEMDNLLEVK